MEGGSQQLVTPFHGGGVLSTGEEPMGAKQPPLTFQRAPFLTSRSPIHVQPSYSPSLSAELNSVHIASVSDSDYSADFYTENNMAQPPPRERTLTELATPVFTCESWCIQYPDEFDLCSVFWLYLELQDSELSNLGCVGKLREKATNVFQCASHDSKPKMVKMKSEDDPRILSSTGLCFVSLEVVNIHSWLVFKYVKMEKETIIPGNETKEVRVRHAVDSKALASVNGGLKQHQRLAIENTPFKFLLNINFEITICGPLIRELLSRWVEHAGGFRIRARIIPFTPLHVCITLGLRVIGREVTMEESTKSHVESLFGGADITMHNIVSLMKKYGNARQSEDFCRLYILFLFAIILYPRPSTVLTRVPFHLLNDLQLLNEFNWGFSIYDFLVDKITRASKMYVEGKNMSQLHVSGCALVLQVWAIEHLTFPGLDKKSRLFPRVSQWIKIPYGSTKISNVFQNGQVLRQLTASSDDLENHIFLEAENHVPPSTGASTKNFVDNEQILS
ncbi:hypothetical protein Fmac_025207 [Flemingia macrophylla]|uniref:Aminotransferase-like plant mobile domain-containing protein n=1 Tax=Flemingia macrophylla TaxID=520843 RepID=A0ABD1LRL3_9FABA